MRAVFDFHDLNKLGVPLKRVVADSRKKYSRATYFSPAWANIRTGAISSLRRWPPVPPPYCGEQDDFSWNHAWQVPHLAVPGLRWLAGSIAAHVHGDPSRHMPVIGVTGTNGKTSISHWLAQALSMLGPQDSGDRHRWQWLLGRAGRQHPHYARPGFAAGKTRRLPCPGRAVHGNRGVVARVGSGAGSTARILKSQCSPT